MKNDMQACEMIGNDVAKRSFAVYGGDRTGVPVWKATYSRSRLNNLASCRVVESIWKPVVAPIIIWVVCFKTWGIKWD